jgi:hypothetical protein
LMSILDGLALVKRAVAGRLDGAAVGSLRFPPVTRG